MAEENRAAGRSSDERGKRRHGRRYFRRKGQELQEQSEAVSQPARGRSKRGAESPALTNIQAEAREARRVRRRRRRSRLREGSENKASVNVSVTDYTDYVAPASVYIYTHVSYPELTEKYESRVEHFSNIGRKMEDYAIDLSKILTSEGTIQMSRIKVNFDDIEFDEPEEPVKPAGKSTSGKNRE
jgi:hypothetical protein